MKLTSMPKPNNRLLALSAAALSLPAMTPAANAVAPTESTLSYRFSQYREEDLDKDRVSTTNVEQGGGSHKRYDIDVNQYGFNTPIGSHFALNIDVQDETLSGATPWGTELDTKGTAETTDDEVKVVMSGASIREHRTEINIGSTYFYDSGTISAVVGTSHENDYDSYSGGISWGGEFFQKLVGVAAGISFSDDTLDPTRGTEPGRGGWLNGYKFFPDTEKKQSVSGYVSASRIVSPNAIVQSGVSYTQKTGYLSDPYKRTDSRPDERNQYTWNVSYRQWLKPIKAAAHADYRLYSDDWGVVSHTIQLALYKNWQKLQVVPSFRYYEQSEADFYVPVPGEQELKRTYFADDSRLSEFGAITVGLKVIFKQKPVDWILAGEYYTSSADMSFGKSEYLENPALVTYTKFTFGVEHRF